MPSALDEIKHVVVLMLENRLTLEGMSGGAYLGFTWPERLS